MFIRPYMPEDWFSIERIHDSARKTELALAGLSEAFVPLRIAAGEEELFDYPGLFVAECDGEVVGFAACTEEELAWLYVDPTRMRQGIGRALAQYTLEQYPTISSIEALKGNEPARKLYESLGFCVSSVESGQMPGNETFHVEVYCMKR